MGFYNCEIQNLNCYMKVLKNILLMICFGFMKMNLSEAASYTPESILPAGVDSTLSINPYTGESGEVRKGTVAATLNNIAHLNSLLALDETPDIQNQIIEISSAIQQLIPSLQAVGLFDLFELTYWIGTGEQPGRVLTAILYFKTYPQKCTPSLKQQLIEARNKFKSPYLLELIAAFEEEHLSLT